MGKLANVSGKEAAKAFQKAGWQPLGQVGSHLVLVKPGLRVNLFDSPTQGTLYWYATASYSQR